jgi:hypothetical protein
MLGVRSFIRLSKNSDGSKTTPGSKEEPVQSCPSDFQNHLIARMPDIAVLVVTVLVLFSFVVFLVSDLLQVTDHSQNNLKNSFCRAGSRPMMFGTIFAQ